MGLQEWDSFALKSYSFAVHKTNSFFSLPTLLLSLVIVGISVLLNLGTVSNLWLPLQSLNIDSSLSLEIPEALTSTLVCIKPLSAANIGKFHFYRTNYSQLIFPRVSEAQVATNFPTFYSQIGRGFECADLAGFSFNSNDDIIYITVSDSQAQIFIKGSSFQQIFYGNYTAPVSLQNTNTSISTKHYYVSYIKFSIQDSLYVGAQPTVYNTFKSQTSAIYFDVYPNLSGSQKALFSFSLYVPKLYYLTQSQNYNVVNFSVARYNISYIIGAILSWVSLFILIFGFIATPLMDKMLSLLTAQSLFYLQPEAQKPSLLKYCIAQLKSGIFKKEDKYVRICQRVEKMKNVGVIVKLQLLLARLFPNSMNILTEEQIASQHSFNQVSNTQSAINLFQSEQKTSGSDLQLQEDEQDVSCLTSIRKKLLYFFDTGSDSISVNYSKGGIGSECSFIVTAVISLGFICFLFYFGVFSISSTTQQQIVKMSDVSYTTIDSELVMTISNNALVPPTIYLMDGTYKILSEITLTKGDACKNTIPAAKLSKILFLQVNANNFDFYCFPSFPLQISPDTSQTRLVGIDLSLIDTSVIVNIYQVAKVQSDQFQPVELVCLKTTGYSNSYTFYNVVKTKLNNINQNGNTVTISQFLPQSQQQNNIFVNGLRGTTIQLLSDVTNINVTNGSIFDVVQSVWSFSIVVFTIVVVKLTKYINLKEKQKKITSQKAEFRDSICVMLSRIDGLLKGRQSKELQNIKHYVKQKITTY